MGEEPYVCVRACACVRVYVQKSFHSSMYILNINDGLKFGTLFRRLVICLILIIDHGLVCDILCATTVEALQTIHFGFYDFNG